MVSFDYCTPTRLVFGKGVIQKLPGIMRPYGSRVLLVYGGGSIKTMGLYDKVIDILGNDFSIYELAGVQPNPKLSSVEEGARLCKANDISSVLAVGGGSVLDCAKSIAACACSDAEPWDVITKKAPVTRALPIIDIITLSATGSEYDANSVISRPETNDKLCLKSEHIFPACSLLDPEYTFSVSKKQTAAGASDAINHVMEKYFTEPVSELADGMCEAVIRSIMRSVRLALKNPNDFDARAELMVDCALACNNVIALGNGASGWPMHAIEHALSAYYDITHGEGLAIITPRYLSLVLEKDPKRVIPRLLKFGSNILGLNPAMYETEHDAAVEVINEIYRFFVGLGVPMRLKDVGIDKSRIDEMARHIVEKEAPSRFWVPLSEEDIVKILTDSL